jgi:hypothetical protein
VRGTKKKGLVDILFGNKFSGKVAATFEAKENGISGMLVTDNEESRMRLSDHLGKLAESLRGADGEAVDLRIAKLGEQDMTRYEKRILERQLTDADNSEADAAAPQDRDIPAGTEVSPEASREEDYHVQTSRLYHIAECFIQTVQEFL